MLWGGYRKRGQSGDLWLPGGKPGRERTRGRMANEAVASRCIDALDRNDIHFVGIYRYGALLWQADLFEDRALVSLFQQVTPSERRHGYDKLMQQVMQQDDRLLELLSLVRSDEVTRLVLDVARGAVYVLPLGDGEHTLVGATLMQTQVEDGDMKITSLHRDLMAAAFG
jgi:hypothetical protein